MGSLILELQKNLASKTVPSLGLVKTGLNSDGVWPNVFIDYFKFKLFTRKHNAS